MSSGTLRQSAWSITINGTAYTITGGGPAKVLGISVTAGFDQQVIEATITVAGDDGHPNIGDWIQIEMGATDATKALRFAGYFLEYDYTLYPRQVGLVCRSPLVRAQNFTNPAINGTDLTGTPSGSGQTDVAIVEQILAACGLIGDSHYSRAIGGLGRVLGKKATQYFVWSEGDDGLSAIQLIDEISKGYRTFDKIDRIGSVPTLVREQVSIIPSGAPVATFNQGEDILEATNQISVLASRNLFLVTGYNASTAKPNANSYAKNGLSGSPLPYPSQWSYASSLIEYDTEAHRPSGEGVSCEEIADWANDQYNRLLIKTPFTTQRDDIIDPGDLIGVIATAARIGEDLGSSLYWVQSVTNAIDEAGAYAQKFVCVQGGS